MKDVFIVHVEGLVVVEIGATELPGIIESEAPWAIAIPCNVSGLIPSLYLRAWFFGFGAFESGLYSLDTADLSAIDFRYASL
jgi:hypothetical protein